MIILSIIIKNLKIIFRSPFTILLLIFFPIILMFLVGFAYSGMYFTDTNVGLIQTDKSIFTIRGVSFNEYNQDDFYQARDSCLLDLKKGVVELCVNFKSSYNNKGNLVNANIIYYVDDTRSQVSSMLINNFNILLDVKTREISTKTIEDIFAEVKDTVVFMNESKNFTSNIYNDLDLAEEELSGLKLEFESINKEYNKKYPSIVNNINELKSSIKLNEDNLDNLRKNIVSLRGNMEDADDELEDSIDDIDSILQKIQIYAQINPEINSYISISDVNSIRSNLIEASNILRQGQWNMNSAINNIDSIPDSDDLLDSLDELEDYTRQTKDYLNDALVKSDLVLSNIKQRKEDIKKIQDSLDEKLDYFEELSNQQASSITEPIKKETKNIFNNFSRVHQLAPTVVILVILFVGLLLSNVIVSLEINSKAYFRNLISPVSQWKFVISLFFTSFIIVSIQILFLFFILHSFFGIKLFNYNLPIALNLYYIGEIFIVILHLLLIFILLGILLAYLFSSIQISILVTTFIMLFMFLLSDIIIPLNIMPEYISLVIKYNPVVFGQNLIRLLFFYSKYYSLRLFDILIFYPFIIILIILVDIASHMRKRKLF